MNQNALTLITVIRDEQSAPLTTLLKDKKEALNTAFKSIGTVHYARFVIIDGTTINNEVMPPQLVLSSNFVVLQNRFLFWHESCLFKSICLMILTCNDGQML